MYKDQTKFDRNNDGRLNSREWSDWYFHKYGLGIEEEERRQVEGEVRNWESWLNTNLSALEKTYADVHRECRALMTPWSKEKERMVDHVFASMILKGLRHGKAWDIVLQTNCEQIYVHNRSFRPYQELTKAFLSRYPSVSSFSQIAGAVHSTNDLFPEDCRLTEEQCGRFCYVDCCAESA